MQVSGLLPVHEMHHGSMNLVAQQVCIPWHRDQDNTAGVQTYCFHSAAFPQ